MLLKRNRMMLAIIILLALLLIPLSSCVARNVSITNAPAIGGLENLRDQSLSRTTALPGQHVVVATAGQVWHGTLPFPTRTFAGWTLNGAELRPGFSTNTNRIEFFMPDADVELVANWNVVLVTFNGAPFDFLNDELPSARAGFSLIYMFDEAVNTIDFMFIDDDIGEELYDGWIRVQF